MKDLVEILKDIVKIDSMNPPGNENSMVDYIYNYFKDHREKLIIKHKENRKSIIIKFNGNTDETVSFIGHIDTVSASRSDGWKYKPLDPVEENGYIYGRGTSDMKSGVACMIYLAKKLINVSTKKSYLFVFTADEEQGGMGIKDIMDKGILDDTDFFVVPEPTSLNLGIKEKGALWIKFILKGKSSHGAFPENGVNAIDMNYSLIYKIRKSLEEINEKDNLLGWSTISNNKIVGGVQSNIVPNLCESYLDIRLTPKISNKEFIRIIDWAIIDIKKEYGQESSIEYEIINDREAIEADLNNKYIKDFREIVEKINPEFQELGIKYYTDASDIIPKLRKPFIIFGPGDENLCHQVNERVKIKNLKIALNIYEEFIV